MIGRFVPDLALSQAKEVYSRVGPLKPDEAEMEFVQVPEKSLKFY